MADIDLPLNPRYVLPGCGGDLPMVHPHTGEKAWLALEGGLTKREFSALSLRVPMSGNAELDAMIREARRWDMATAVLQGFAAETSAQAIRPSDFIQAGEHADALLSRLSAPRTEGGGT